VEKLMNPNSLLPERLRVAHLSVARDNTFDLNPDAETRQRIAEALGLLSLPKMRFHGQVRARGRDEWVLEGELQASVVQPCVVTLDPVRTALREEVHLIFTPHLSQPDEEEVEMGDDTLEPLGAWIQLGGIAIEALSLALPTNPRKPDAEMPEEATDPLDIDEPPEPRKPFAGLADMMKKDK